MILLYALLGKKIRLSNYSCQTNLRKNRYLDCCYKPSFNVTIMDKQAFVKHHQAQNKQNSQRHFPLSSYKVTTMIKQQWTTNEAPFITSKCWPLQTSEPLWSTIHHQIGKPPITPKQQWSYITVTTHHHGSRSISCPTGDTILYYPPQPRLISLTTIILLNHHEPTMGTLHQH